MVSNRPNYLLLSGEKPPTMTQRNGSVGTQSRSSMRKSSLAKKPVEETKIQNPIENPKSQTHTTQKLISFQKISMKKSPSTIPATNKQEQDSVTSFKIAKDSEQKDFIKESKTDANIETEDSRKVNELSVDDISCKVFSCRVDPTDKFIAAGENFLVTEYKFYQLACEDGKVRVYIAETAEVCKEIKLRDRSESVEISVKWRPNPSSELTQDMFVAYDTGGRVYHVHAPSNKIIYNFEQRDNEIYTLDYALDGSKFAIGGINKKVEVYDDFKKTISNVLRAGVSSPVHENRVLAVKFLKDHPNVLLSAGWDNTVIIWDIRTKSSSGCIFGPQVYGEALDCQGNNILTGNSREGDQIEIFDIRTLKPVTALNWDSNPAINKKAFIYTAQFSKYDNAFIGAGSTGLNQMKILYNQQGYLTRQTFEKAERAVLCLDFFNLSNKFVYCGNRGLLGIVSSF